MNKARQFEDFILDDYDYNLLEDWDLEYLWEWVEFDDFSDLEEDFYNAQGFDPDGDYEEDSEEDDNNAVISSNMNTGNSNGTQVNDEDDYNFDFDFDSSDDDNADYGSNPSENNDDFDDTDLEGDDFLRSIGLLDDQDDDTPNNHISDDQDHLLGGSRYIETSAGKIDLEFDDILGALQKVDFDEFISILQKNNHVYDKILIQQEWSQEEMEFLQSIEPLVRDTPPPDTLNKAEHKKQNNPPIITEPINHKLINTQTYKTVKEMFEDLVTKATILARKNQHKIYHVPKNIHKMWHIDTEKKRENRIKLMFGDTIHTAEHSNIKVQKQPTRNNLASVIYGKNEIRYLELKEILTNEIKNMVMSLDKSALDFIRQDGKRFSFQFTDFLVQKYGSKIYYLYQSQMKNDLSADRLSDDLSEILTVNLSPANPHLFLTHFFEAIIIILEKQGLEF